ncbi:MAG: hypothetical protein Q9219_002501 [cf. Caloplaca sp. 3 TL-2023]
MWNEAVPPKVNTCVHEIVLKHARTNPQAPAVCSWDGNLTYEELDRKSFHLALRFIEAGVTQEALIPVCFKKSLHAVVAMLAIHRAGGAFVPLDPSHPEDRLRAVVDKAKATVVVTSPETAHLFKNMPVASIQVTSSMMETSGAADDSRTLPSVRPDHAAFVLFTSGSTGKPKGILQEHASVCTSALAHGRALQVSSDSRVFQYAAFTFDVSMMDIFTTLICGGCVCIPSEEERMGSFTNAMNRMRVNWVLFTPSVASLVNPEDVPLLETLVYGGEAVKQENVSRWVGKVRLFNCYGPAECGACAIGEFIRPDSRPANIGRQFGGELCWVVDPDRHNRLLPIGAPGELVVEGPTLARGYLDDLPKTQASFIKSPAWPQGAGHGRVRRIYKTGDLVRQNSDGTFDYLGRKDLQVKVRGQRVEIGEVEHHISTYPGIALSMVARPQSGPYGQTLVAIMQLVSTSDTKGHGNDLDHLPNEYVLAADFDRKKLLSSLRMTLPNYMVPTHVLVVSKLPLSVSGKIDRKVVDAWLIRTSRPVESTFMSETLTSNLLQDDVIALEICSTVLSLVSEHGSTFYESLDGQNFLLSTIGLDSIKIISLIMFIRRRFGVKIGLDILMNPNSHVEDISRAVTTLLRNDGITTIKHTVDLMDTFQTYKKKALESVGKRRTPIINVLLTGATGFLGSRILRELCRQQRVHRIIVLVRSQNAQKAMQRIIQSAMLAGWRIDDFANKIEAWPGDLAKPRLGLVTERWSRLCGHGSPQDRVTAIIHNGAIVNWNANFAALKATNVDSTVDLLSAASESAVLSHVVFVSGGQQLKIEADNDLEIAEEVGRSNGYAQTKFLSELMVKEYGRSVAPWQQRVSIIKPGYIIGGIEDGICATDDFIWRLAAGCADIESYNAEDADSWLFVSDVDHVATTIAECCENGQVLPTGGVDVVKILDGLYVSEFWNLIDQEIGCEIRPLSAESWSKRLYADIERRGDKHALWPLLETVEQGQGKLGAPLKSQNSTRRGDKRVMAAICKNVEYLQSIGFLPKSGEERRIRNDIGLDSCSVFTPLTASA